MQSFAFYVIFNKSPFTFRDLISEYPPIRRASGGRIHSQIQDICRILLSTHGSQNDRN